MFHGAMYQTAAGQVNFSLQDGCATNSYLSKPVTQHATRRLAERTRTRLGHQFRERLHGFKAKADDRQPIDETCVWAIMQITCLSRCLQRRVDKTVGTRETIEISRKQLRYKASLSDALAKHGHDWQRSGRPNKSFSKMKQRCSTISVAAWAARMHTQTCPVEHRPRWPVPSKRRRRFAHKSGPDRHR